MNGSLRKRHQRPHVVRNEPVSRRCSPPESRCSQPAPRSTLVFLLGAAALGCGLAPTTASATEASDTDASDTDASDTDASDTKLPPERTVASQKTTKTNHALPQPSVTEPVRPLTGYRFSDESACPACSSHPRIGLHWHDHWTRVGSREAIVPGVAATSYIGMRLFADSPSAANWAKPILFDQLARDHLALDSRDGRGRASTISDVLYFGAIAQTLVIDTAFVAWWGHDNPDVAWQMSVINAQAYALSLSLTRATKHLVARERPYAGPCTSDSSYDKNCNQGPQNMSFFSGHAATTATSAGLSCAHHTHLQLYGEPLLDAAACLFAVGVTTTTGVLRVASDNHHASDVLTGQIVGYLVGYLYPTLLYYQDFRTTPENNNAHSSRAAVVPVATPSSLSIDLIGLF